MRSHRPGGGDRGCPCEGGLVRQLRLTMQHRGRDAIECTVTAELRETIALGRTLYDPWGGRHDRAQAVFGSLPAPKSAPPRGED